jgi:TetR/AcrR family transcriptional regulator, regulator of cefoperazone and chloramphenicol sensitivity
VKESIDRDLSRKDTIIKVTLDIIMEEGLEAVTIRKIASLANVNIALIHYHFGSKENLVNEALKILVNNLRTSFTLLDDSDLAPREKLKTFLVNYVNLAIKYRDVIKQVFINESFSFQSQSEFMLFLKNFGFGKIQLIIKDITGKNDPKELLMMMLQLMGSVIFPIIMFPEMKLMLGIDATTLEGSEAYIDALLENYFGKYTEPNKN